MRARRRHHRGGRRAFLLTASIGCLVLGIVCIGWGLANIVGAKQNVTSADASATPINDLNVLRPEQSPLSTPTIAATQSVPPSGTKRKALAASYVKDPAPGDAMGTLVIPALKQSVPIIEGTGTNDLKKGAGHYTRSVFPGQKDNCVLSAHRDTYFSRLGELKKGDRVTVKTAAGTFVYEVRRIRIVGKDDRTVIVPTDHGVLTLTTCYPFDYIGSAPKRYIVSADMVTGK